MSDVIARVISQKGACEAGHKVGIHHRAKDPAWHLFMGILRTFPFCGNTAIRRFIPLGKGPKQGYRCLSRPGKSSRI